MFTRQREEKISGRIRPLFKTERLSDLFHVFVNFILYRAVTLP